MTHLLARLFLKEALETAMVMHPPQLASPCSSGSPIGPGGDTPPRDDPHKPVRDPQPGPGDPDADVAYQQDVQGQHHHLPRLLLRDGGAATANVECSDVKHSTNGQGTLCAGPLEGRTPDNLLRHVPEGLRPGQLKGPRKDPARREQRSSKENQESAASLQ